MYEKKWKAPITTSREIYEADTCKNLSDFWKGLICLFKRVIFLSKFTSIVNLFTGKETTCSDGIWLGENHSNLGR